MLDLAEQRDGINHNAVANHADFAGMQDARRNQVQYILLVANLYRMPRVVAALIAHDHVGLFREHINDFALALIAPLGPH